MSVTRSTTASPVGNVIATLMGSYKLPFVVMDGELRITGIHRKSKLMMVRTIHYRDNTSQHDRHGTGEGAWEATCRHLRVTQRIYAAATMHAVIDPKSKALCVVPGGRGYRVWDASIDGFYPVTFNEDELVTFLLDFPGMSLTGRNRYSS